MNKKIKIKFWDIFITSIISLFLTVKCYGFLYDKIHWYNLPDFYVGVSIFNDHNKYLDIYIYFVYLILFFIIYPFFSKLTNKIYNKEKETTFKLLEKIKPFLPKLVKLQYLFVFGYIFLHPFDGNFYPKLAFVIMLLISYSIYNIYKTKDFSPFSLTALFFIFNFTGYSIGIAPSDDHHFGEKFATFLMHNNFNMEYYKDIMLVHGLMDISSSWLGNFFFGQNNIYGYCLGEALNRNIIFIITILTSLYIFGKNILYIVPVMLMKVPSLSVLYATVYILISNIKKPVLLFWLYIVLSVLFASFWTTIGGFWVIASMPLFIYICYKMPNKKLNFWLAIIFLLLLSIIFRNNFFEYLNQAKYYIQGTLYSFGNDFINIDNKMPVEIAFEWMYKMFALFFIPVIVLELIKQFKNKNREIFFLLFSLIFVMVSLKYTLGRLDNGTFIRLEYISFPFLCIIAPYWIYKFATNNQKVMFERIISFILVIFILHSLFIMPEKLKRNDYISKTTLNNVGNIKLESIHEKRLSELNDYFKDKGTFLDLTNRGMHYLYFNKKIPVLYTSFYNSIVSKQAVESVERIRKNPPDNILIFSNNILFDDVFPSLRINALYRWIFLKGKYEYKTLNDNIFLVKTDKIVKYSQEQLDDLDYYLSANNLKFLPEVWANSIKTLPLVKVAMDYTIQTYGNEISIKFSQPIKVQNVDLLYFDTGIAEDFRISINNSKTKMYCQSKSGKILIPLDNFPSWLLNNNLKEIVIETNEPVKSQKIEFYNRTYNHML